MNKRINPILEFLTEENKIKVSQLAEKLGVSQVLVGPMIQQYVENLCQKGI